MWFSRAKCPVESDDARWIEASARLLVTRLGEERVRTCPVVRPTRQYFPDGIGSDDEAVRRAFVQVCGWANVDERLIRLELYDEQRAEPVAPTIPIRSLGTDSCTAGTYDLEHGPRIRISRSNFGSPVQTIAVLAHEVAHHVLIHDLGMDSNDEDHEPLTDLTTVFLGLAWFGARACVHDRSWSGGGLEGWTIQRCGYLPQPLWGYGLAAFAWLREATQPDWVEGLPPGVAGPVKRGLRYLARTAEPGRLPH